MRIEVFTCAALALSVMARAADDPNALVEKAQKAQANRDYDNAITLLKQADASWENSTPNAPEHAQALEHLAVLMKSQATKEAEQRGQKSAGADLELWRSEAAPVVKRALAICEANGDAKPEDLALGLELQADVLGRKEDGAPFWDRATKIRAQRVAGIHATVSSQEASVASDGVRPERIGGAVSRPVPVTKRPPDYTDTALLTHYEGSALFSVIIDEHGLPTNIQLVRGLGYGLDEKGAEAITAWRFRPAMKNGVPVAVQATSR